MNDDQQCASQAKRRVDLNAFRDGGWFWETPMAKQMERDANEADAALDRGIQILLERIGVKQ